MLKKFTKKQKLNKTNILDKVPDRSGVYKIYNKNDSLKYIGHAGGGRLKERILEHVNEKDIAGADNFQFMPTTSKREAESLEKKLIKKEKPTENIKLNN